LFSPGPGRAGGQALELAKFPSENNMIWRSADLAQLPMAQQQAYCNAYNQHMEENPEADEEECDAAGRAAIEPRDSADAAANLEAVRAAYQADYVRRISNAWKT
jgi:ribulose bisphosphate carboxylase small subunit